MPRHPPCALNNLTTKIKDARVHCAVLKLRAGERSGLAARLRRRRPFDADPAPGGAMREPARRPASCPLRTQQRAWQRVPHLRPSHSAHIAARGCTNPRANNCASLVNVPPMSIQSTDIRPITAARHGSGRGTRPFGRRPRQVLLRKEVIQPHLPVRLPCYDFVPIAGPTFDGSLHKGWATGFGCYRLS